MQFEGKAALIAGAGGAICRAIALAFAAEGANVACCDINEDAAAETARLVEATGRKAIARGCDVSSEAEPQAAADAALAASGRLDILVSGAAPHDPGGPVHEIPIAEWRQVVDINLTGSFLL